ncbi:MAG: DUF4911 domain-containing protein [Thermodesulfobacteriota bacterium]|nr:DUF4911 domain-containing protein [Thermodesulfobacteriota bacterium]
MQGGKKTSRRYFRMDRREIAFLRFVFEGYDGLAVLTTLDAAAGTVVLSIAPGCEDEVEKILADLKKEILMEDTGFTAEDLPY